MKKNMKFLIILLGILIMLFLSFSYFQRGDAGNSGYIEGKSFYTKPKIEKQIKIAEPDCNPVFYKDVIIYVVVQPGKKIGERITYDTILTALDTKNLQPKWERRDLYYYSDYQIYEDKLYIVISRVNIDRNIVLCLNPETGETIWERKIELKKDVRLNYINFYKNMILISADDAKIYFLNKDTGKIVRERQFLYKDRENVSAQWFENGVTSIMYMSVSGDIVVFLHLAYGYIAYDIAADKVIWIYRYKSSDNEQLWKVWPVLDSDSAYLRLEENIIDKENKILRYFQFVCVDLKTGKEKWRIENKPHKVDPYFTISPSVVDKEKVYIEAQGIILAYDKQTGKKIWEFSLDKQKGIPKSNYEFAGFMTFYLMKIGDVLYYPLDTFYAIDGRTGKLLWWDKLSFKSFAKDSLMNQYVRCIGIYKDKLYLLSRWNDGEDFGYLYVLSY